VPVTNAEWEVSVDDVKARLDRGEPLLLIDVREPDEHQFCRIEGARLVPLDRLASEAQQIMQWADDRPVVLHCHRGRRSLTAAAILRECGLADAWSMAGGIDEWSRRIDPTVPQY